LAKYSRPGIVLASVMMSLVLLVRAGLPVDLARIEDMLTAAQTGLEGMCDHLLERRKPSAYQRT